MKPKAILKLGLAGLMIVCGASFAAGSDKNYATQLELKNCGGYLIDEIILQRKAEGDGHWAQIDTFDFTGTNLGNGQSFCVDMSDYKQFKNGDQGRLKAHIVMGDTQKCDGTNYGESNKGRRKMEMAGTTKNNNGCRSKNYKNTRPPSQCSKGNHRHYEGPCS